ncbi:MAG: leucine-rich repeat domain-containing protein [Clostridia bacterium]|nr:leucine-rich repeat domain-containing protein [Clostridia bacterium]
MSISQKTEYSRIYSDMGGVDFTGDGSAISKTRFSYLENMYRDYDGDGAAVLVSVPGFRELYRFGKKINGIFAQKNSSGEEFTVVHAGSDIYRFKTAERDSISSLSPVATVKDTNSRAFSFGDSLFILDGDTITKIDADGAAGVLGSTSPAYIPTTYVNGTPHEQRNILSNRFIERYSIGMPDSVAAASAGLVFRISDEDNRYCILTDGSAAVGAVYLPRSVVIDGVDYQVREIAASAFARNANISTVSIPEGVVKIGANAFFGCPALMNVYCPDTLEEIGTCAFYECARIKTLYLGVSLKTIGADAFFGNAFLEAPNYALDMASYLKIDGYDELDYTSISYHTSYHGMRASIPVFSGASAVDSVTLNGVEIMPNGGPIRVGGITVAYEFTVESKESLMNAEVVISGVIDSSARSKNGCGSDFFDIEESYAADPQRAILGCTLCESFDGRIFLSGNPSLPNTVFYSSRNESGRNDPTYYGVFNYFRDGEGGFGVSSLLAAGDSLAVFKEGDDGAGSIFYHTPYETGDDIVPKVYPVSYIHRGFLALGDSLSFFDDPVFLSSLGLCALDKKALYLERSIACRSHTVNAKLLTEDLGKARLAKWCGYLVISCDGRMYLADSRAKFTHETKNTEYEWYYLNGIGVYEDSRAVFRYSSNAKEGYLVLEEMIGKRAETEEVMSEYSGDELVYYIKDGERKYAVERTRESEGGSFYPASEIYSDGTLLFFGTKSGALCVFNNDKRGVAPDRISHAPDFDPEEYAGYYARKIHPEFYDFATRPPRYVLKTARDSCSVPHLCKDTVKNSLTVKFKMFTTSAVKGEVVTDRTGYSEVAQIYGGDFCFTDMDFTRFSFENAESFTLAFREKEKRWVEKQVEIYSEELDSPIGVYMIAYRFTVRGKVKNN